MNNIKVKLPIFPGATKVWDCCHLVAMEEELDSFITGDEVFNGYEINGHIQIEMYSPKTGDTRPIMYFKNGLEVNMKECYSALVDCIKAAFAEEFI